MHNYHNDRFETRTDDSNDYRRNVMSGYEVQIHAIGTFHDAVIPAAEQNDMEMLSSAIPGSSLDETMNNPMDSGIDEG